VRGHLRRAGGERRRARARARDPARPPSYWVADADDRDDTDAIATEHVIEEGILLGVLAR